MSLITVVGAGLSGCEAAWQLAVRGIEVTLVEQKPLSRSPAHKTDGFSELVCSNSLRGASLSTAPGLLKEEMRRCGSLIIEAADRTCVPAGGALAVDRSAFSEYITEKIKSHPKIKVKTEIVDKIPEGKAIIATGPLTCAGLAKDIEKLLGEPLSFYDAAAPIVAADSIIKEKTFIASRYGKGDDDYVNCPMNKEEYELFVRKLASAEEAPVHGFEDKKVFEGCMPVEVMARRGEDTLRYGPLKPVGLTDPETGKRPYAVVQLRAENREKTMYNIVGFQTHLKMPEQKRVFGLIPALKNAVFLRYGVMHRNTFINSPGKLNEYYEVTEKKGLMFAGQITGVEGYIESAASGLCCGINAARSLLSKSYISFPPETALFALSNHVSRGSQYAFQPMNINFGLLPKPCERIKDKRERYLKLSERSLFALSAVLAEIKEDVL